MGSAFAPAVVAVVAVVAALVRWSLQGSRNFYTALSQRFYVQTPEGWVESDQHAVWLGLELIAAFAALVLWVAALGWFLRRRERKTNERSTILRAIAWISAVMPLVVVGGIFARGFGPEGGVTVKPEVKMAEVIVKQDAPINGSLDLPAGRYAVVAHKNTSVSAKLHAGGDEFDAVFAGDPKGEWRGDPKDLTKPMSAEISVAAASVDTGIDARSSHAKGGYLKSEKFPRVGWKLDKLLASQQEGDRVLFRAAGSVELMGKTHPVEVTGYLRKPDAAALTRLGLEAPGGAVLLVEATFALVIKDTALAGDAGDFKGDRFPIHASLVLRHTGD